MLDEPNTFLVSPNFQIISVLYETDTNLYYSHAETSLVENGSSSRTPVMSLSCRNQIKKQLIGEKHDMLRTNNDIIYVVLLASS